MPTIFWQVTQDYKSSKVVSHEQGHDFFFALFCFFIILHGKLSLHFRGMLSWNLNLTRSFIIWLCSSLFQHPLLAGSTFLHASYSCLFIWVFNVSAEKVTKVHQLKEDLHNIYVPDESFMKGHFYEGSYHWKDEQFCCIWWKIGIGSPKLVDELSLLRIIFGRFFISPTIDSSFAPLESAKFAFAKLSSFVWIFTPKMHY